MFHLNLNGSNNVSHPFCVWSVFQMNGTDDGDYVFYSGTQNYKDFARVALWKGQRYVTEKQNTIPR